MSQVNRTGSFDSKTLSKWAFAQSLRFVPKGQTLSTQTDGMSQVLKMEAVCVVELLNAVAIAVSCCDGLCYLFKLFFPRRLLEDYFVVLIDTFKLSIAIILTLFFYPVITFSIRMILISFCEK